MASIKADRELEEVPAAHVAVGEQVDLDKVIHPFFSVAPRAPRARQAQHAGAFDPAVALVVHYNVDGITDEKIVFVGSQANSLKLSARHQSVAGDVA